MRVTPIALAAPDLGSAVDAARRDAELIHGDPVTGAVQPRRLRRWLRFAIRRIRSLLMATVPWVGRDKGPMHVRRAWMITLSAVGVTRPGAVDTRESSVPRRSPSLIRDRSKPYLVVAMAAGDGGRLVLVTTCIRLRGQGRWHDRQRRNPGARRSAARHQLAAATDCRRLHADVRRAAARRGRRCLPRRRHELNRWTGSPHRQRPSPTADAGSHLEKCERSVR